MSIYCTVICSRSCCETWVKVLVICVGRSKVQIRKFGSVLSRFCASEAKTKWFKCWRWYFLLVVGVETSRGQWVFWWFSKLNGFYLPLSIVSVSKCEEGENTFLPAIPKLMFTMMLGLRHVSCERESGDEKMREAGLQDW